MKTLYKNPKPLRDTVAFKCFLERETDKAFMIDSEAFKEAVWVPKSQVLTYKLATKPNEEDEIIMTQWIAETKGLVPSEESPVKPVVAPLKGQSATVGQTEPQQAREPGSDDDKGGADWDDDMPF
jgi:hypothetical protein